MKMLLATIISFSGFLALAEQGPRIEPGPAIKLEEVASEAVDALLLAKQADLKVFIKAGNETKEISRQNLQPGVTEYNFLRQSCSLGGITGGLCLGGAALNVVITEKREGSIVTVTATSSVQLIK